MSRHIDINQLLDEMGTSDRSANDPWTLSRSSAGVVRRDAFDPAVAADLGAPIGNLSSGMQSSERITQAEIAAATNTSSNQNSGSSSGGGLLGGLLNMFPLASGIAKLFGFGSGTPTPAPTPYELPPSINFEGAMAGPTSGVTSLSYGANGLPRTNASSQPATNFTSTPAGEIGGIAGRSAGDNPATQAVTSNTSGIAGQLETLASSDFAPEPSAASPLLGSSLTTAMNAGLGTGSSLDPVPAETSGSNSSGTSTSNTQQGHSILVQVQAMDSQSFMDHSHDIAQAVRQAMLNMNSLNDVVADL